MSVETRSNTIAARAVASRSTSSPTTRTGVLLVAVFLLMPAAAQAQYSPYPGRCCPPNPYVRPPCPCPHPYPHRPGERPSPPPKPGDKYDGKKKPGEGEVQPPPTDPQTADLTADQTAPSVAQATGYSSTATPMFGDFGGFSGIGIAGGVKIPFTEPGRGIRFSVADNQSPMPQQRVYFNYQYLHNNFTTLSFDANQPQGFDIIQSTKQFDSHRFLFGMEHLVLYGAASIQFQVPFANSLGSDIVGQSAVDGPAPGEQDTELGNISLILKGVLYRDCWSTLSVGLGIDLPTAEDVSLSFVTTGERLEIENQTVLLHPFVGLLYTPNPVWFFQAFAQASLPVGTNDSTYAAGGAVNSFEIDPRSLLRLNGSAGAWLYQACHCCRCCERCCPCCEPTIKGVAAMTELHYTTKIEHGQDFEIVAPGPDNNLFVDTTTPLDYLNLTLALQVACRNNTAVRAGVVLPLLGGGVDPSDQPFDWEFQLQVNRFF